MSINGAGQGALTKNSLVLRGNTFTNNTVWCPGAIRLECALDNCTMPYFVVAFLQRCSCDAAGDWLNWNWRRLCAQPDAIDASVGLHI